MPSQSYIIAEAGVNHNGSEDTARSLIDLAARARCDAVKFQLFRARQVVAADAARAPYQGGGTQESLLVELELPSAAMSRLARRACEAGIDFVCTPFDSASAWDLDALDVPFFKVSSGDISSLGFLEELGALGRPIVLSTGTADLGEVESAVAAVRRGQARARGRRGRWTSWLSGGLALLHCVTSYPAPAEQANLRAMDTLAGAFGVPVGYSDHTRGPEACLAATARGAVCIEKHFTLDKSLSGPDHAASCDESELSQLVRSIRRVESALGSGLKAPAACERENLSAVRRKACASRSLRAGQVLSGGDLIALRSETGVPADRMDLLVGRALARDVPARHCIQWEDV